MSTHYEERLQKDLTWIEDLVAIVGANVENATKRAVQAMLTLDLDLAAEVVVGDYLVNRQTRELDRLCHAFVARHLPSAGHLRYVSSVMRLSIALERIGDYAATISRGAAQLSSDAPPVVKRDIALMCDRAGAILHDALRSFQLRDVGLAVETQAAAAHFVHNVDKVFADLLGEGEARTRPVNDLFSLLATFNRLERVIHQAKNICEETVFVGTGKPKGEKTFQILFLDGKNDGPSQLAEHFTRKAFPQSGQYRSAGFDAGDEIQPAYVQFAQELGLDLARAWPTPLASVRDRLQEFHFVVGLAPDTRRQLGKVPFHTTVMVWDLDGARSPAEVYRAIAPRIRTLVEQLRGEQAC